MKKKLVNNGEWQSVKKTQIENAKTKSKELNAILVYDYLYGRRILSVKYVDVLEKSIVDEIGTNQAVFFELSKTDILSN
jgi:hypothetical protein